MRRRPSLKLAHGSVFLFLLPQLLLLSPTSGGHDEEEGSTGSCAASGASCEQMPPRESHLYTVESNSWQTYLDLIKKAKVSFGTFGTLLLVQRTPK